MQMTYDLHGGHTADPLDKLVYFTIPSGHIILQNTTYSM